MALNYCNKADEYSPILLLLIALASLAFLRN